MAFTVLILGASGVFGKRIARRLSAVKGMKVILGGRDRRKLEMLSQATGGKALAFDIYHDLGPVLRHEQPALVIHTAGPFQGQDYHVAKTCISMGISYIDLADGREFVTNFTQLDSLAREHSVFAISGASTVPTLSAAVVDHYLPRFAFLESITYGISPGNKTERGLGTTSGILSYVGEAFDTWQGGRSKRVFGWQGLHRIVYPRLGKRWMSRCEIPDLSLFPKRYPGLQHIDFFAGLEVGVMHLGLWGLSGLRRANLISNLSRHGLTLHQASKWFESLGSDNGGMHMIMQGKDRSGNPLSISWFLVAKNGVGPEIPAIPAVLYAKRLMNGALHDKGAFPSMGFISLHDYLDEMNTPFIVTHEAQH